MTEEGDDSRGALSDVEIEDNILTMLIAGQDTTASAITWMVKFLDENPDVLQNLKVRWIVHYLSILIFKLLKYLHEQKRNRMNNLRY